MASTGRYQSSVFNFLNRQSQRWRDHYSRTLRQLKLTTTWGAQVLLYPIYALFQTTRIAGKQFQQTVQRVVPLLKTAGNTLQSIRQPQKPERPVTSDTPLQNILQAVESFALFPAVPTSNGLVASDVTLRDAHLLSPCGPETSSIQSLRLPTLQIVGVATLLSNQAIVLVTDHHQLLDILTPEQQHQLQQRIIWEVAHYWRSQREHLPPPSQPLTPLPLPTDRPNLLPPVRVFRHLMAWMQTSPIAIATNLFKESAAPLPFQPQRSKTIAPSPLREPDPWLTDDRLHTTLSPKLLPFQVKSAPTKALTAASPATSHPLPWLDRFRSSFFSQTQPEPETPDSDPTPSSMVPAGPSKLSQRDRRSTSMVPSPPPEPSRDRPTLRTNTPSSPGSSLAAPAQSSDALTPGQSEPTQGPVDRSRAQPTYIDTKATFVGYVKHPLERVLEWLDQGMLWLEQLIARFVQWVRSRWPR